MGRLKPVRKFDRYFRRPTCYSAIVPGYPSPVFTGNASATRPAVAQQPLQNSLTQNLVPCIEIHADVKRSWVADRPAQISVAMPTSGSSGAPLPDNRRFRRLGPCYGFVKESLKRLSGSFLRNSATAVHPPNCGRGPGKSFVPLMHHVLLLACSCREGLQFPDRVAAGHAPPLYIRSKTSRSTAPGAARWPAW